MRTTHRVESFQRNRSKSACSGLSIVLAGLRRVQKKQRESVQSVVWGTKKQTSRDFLMLLADEFFADGGLGCSSFKRCLAWGGRTAYGP